MRLTYKAQDQHGKETGTVWYAITAGSTIFPISDKEEQVLKKLAIYEDAEEQGRLVILPKTLYEVDNTPLIAGVTEWEVTGVRFYDGVMQAYTVKTKNVQTIIWGEEIGKTVFLTHEEAEAALKGGRDNGMDTSV